MIDWKGKTHKGVVREQVLGGKTRDHVFLMPGHTALDVELAIGRGVIGERTAQTYCEKDADIYKLMCRRLREIVPAHYHRPRSFNQHLHELSFRSPVDLAWLDLCGNLSMEDCFFVRDVLLPSLAEGGDVAITLATYFRGNSLMKSVLSACEGMPASTVSRFKNLPRPKTVASQTTEVMCLLSGYRYRLEIIPYESADNNNGWQRFNVFVARDVRPGGRSPLSKRLEGKVRRAMGIL